MITPSNVVAAIREAAEVTHNKSVKQCVIAVWDDKTRRPVSFNTVVPVGSAPELFEKRDVPGGWMQITRDDWKDELCSMEEFFDQETAEAIVSTYEKFCSSPPTFTVNLDRGALWIVSPGFMVLTVLEEAGYMPSQCPKED